MFTIAKLGYSSRPWRLLRDGKEVWVKERFDHPDLGPQVIDGPIAADTKEGAIRQALDLLEIATTRLERDREDAGAAG